MKRWRGGAVLVLAAALAVSGCDDDPEEPDNPTLPTPSVTETYSGTIGVNAAINYTFSSKGAGTITARLTSVLPDNTIAMGLALGTWSGTSCAVIIANDNAREGNVVIGQVAGVGQLCVRLYDIGQITGPTTFEVVVIHP